MDIVTPFIVSKLDEKVSIHLSLEVLGGPRIAHLNCSLYGHKQSPRCWYSTIDELLVTQVAFRRGQFDCSMYRHAKGTVLVLYDDDMLLAGHEPISSAMWKRFKARFNKVNLGYVEYFL